MFQMAGTIVTYELVLLQFDTASNQNSAVESKVPQCELIT